MDGPARVDHRAERVLLQAHEWQHKPHPGEDGGTGYERGRVRVELTFLARDETGGISIPLRDRNAPFSHEPLGNDVPELLGVRARVIPLALLRAGKSSARDHEEAAKDRADFEALSRLE